MKWKEFIKAVGCVLVWLVFEIGRSSVAAEPAGSEGALPRKNKFQRSRLTNDESEGLADRRHLLLTTGEDRAVDMDFDVNAGANGISIGNPLVVATTLAKIGEKRQIVFKPLKAGETNVTIRDNDGTLRLIFMVRITGSSLLRVKGELNSLLRDVEGIDIRVVGSKIVIEGDVLVPNDYGRLMTIIGDKTYSDFVLNMAGLSPLAMQVMAKKIQEDINVFAPNVKTRVVNGMIFLEGSVDTAEDAGRAAKIADLYLPDLKPGSLMEKDPFVQRHPPRQLITSLILINPKPPKKQEKLVRVTVYFVELKKNYQKVFGFKWEPGFTAAPTISIGQAANGAAGAAGAAASNAPNFSATISSLIPRLDDAQTAGYARVLKTGTIIVRSGQPAKLVEQTEFPYQQAGPNGSMQSNTKAVGLTLAVTPLILGQSEDIQLNLELDQTNLTGRGPAPGAPPVTASHKVTTNIYVKSNESAAIAGVMASDIGTDFNIDPPGTGSFAQGTDPLFTLLHSKAFRKQKSQFVIFVTPQIIDNASDGTEDLKKNFRVKVK